MYRYMSVKNWATPKEVRKEGLEKVGQMVMVNISSWQSRWWSGTWRLSSYWVTGRIDVVGLEPRDHSRFNSRPGSMTLFYFIFHSLLFIRSTSFSPSSHDKNFENFLNNKALHCILGPKRNLRPILYYRKRGSASYIVREVQSVRGRERERERDGSSETEVVRRKWRHHCRAKIGDKFALSLAKNSHLSFPASHFPSLSSRRGHLYETSKNSIKLIPKTIGNRKRDCAWGCAGVKKLKKNQLLSTNHHQAKQIWVLMICAQQLIFLQFFNTRASSRTISFSISISFWY